MKSHLFLKCSHHIPEHYRIWLQFIESLRTPYPQNPPVLQGLWVASLGLDPFSADFVFIKHR